MWKVIAFGFGMLIAGSAWAQGAKTPTACATTTVATGGSAVTAVNANSIRSGGFIMNAADATSEGIGATEPLFVDISGAAATTTGNGTNVPLAAGQTFNLVPNSNKTVSVTATTNGHKFTCLIW